MLLGRFRVAVTFKKLVELARAGLITEQPKYMMGIMAERRNDSMNPTMHTNNMITHATYIK
jgi:hypothetical protein